MINEASVEEQKRHIFERNFYDFKGNQQVKTFEIQIALMVNQAGTMQPFAGYVEIFFKPEEDLMSITMPEQLIRETGEKLAATITDEIKIMEKAGKIQVIPESGVVTYEIVQKSLAAMKNAGAISLDEVAKASKFMGVGPVSLEKTDPARTGRSDPPVLF